MTYDQAFERLIGHEGGYISPEQAHANKDPGGETKYGISKRSYPAVNIAELTLDHAKLIYLQDFWGPAGCDAVPDAIKFDLFDMAVNSGVRTAAKMLQRAVGEVEDGAIGPRTLQAVNSMPPDRLVMRFNAHRLIYMTGLKNWPEASRGWVRRCASNMLGA